MNATLPTREERASANSSPLALKAEDTREYYIQTLDLVRSYLKSADDFMTARRIIDDIRSKKGHKILGYPTHEDMLEAEGISLMLKTAKVIITCRENPGITMEELAKKVGCSISLAARAVKDAGLKKPTIKERILAEHIDENGKLHIEGKPASQREVAKHLGCSVGQVNGAFSNSTSGKAERPSRPLATAQKAYLALSEPERAQFFDWLADGHMPKT